MFLFLGLVLLLFSCRLVYFVVLVVILFFRDALPPNSNAYSGSWETQEAKQEAGRGFAKSFLEQDPGHEGMYL